MVWAGAWGDPSSDFPASLQGNWDSAEGSGVSDNLGAARFLTCDSCSYLRRPSSLGEERPGGKHLLPTPGRHRSPGPVPAGTPGSAATAQPGPLESVLTCLCKLTCSVATTGKGREAGEANSDATLFATLFATFFGRTPAQSEEINGTPVSPS